MSAGGRLFSVQVPDWGQDHLTVEAVVAYVDGELAERPYDRATRHLARVPRVRRAGRAPRARPGRRCGRRGCPSLPSSLMSALRSIPHDTELPGAPNGLAMSPDGELVSPLCDPDRVRPARRARRGTARRPASVPASAAGATISGLALGALAIGAVIIAGDTPTSASTGVPPSHRRAPAAARRAADPLSRPLLRRLHHA